MLIIAGYNIAVNKRKADTRRRMPVRYRNKKKEGDADVRDSRAVRGISRICRLVRRPACMI